MEGSCTSKVTLTKHRGGEEPVDEQLHVLPLLAPVESKGADVASIGIALTHGSVMFECAKKIAHCTTPLKKTDRNHPARIGVVFYQHKKLNSTMHGRINTCKRVCVKTYNHYICVYKVVLMRSV